jgi:hypothetical protein
LGGRDLCAALCVQRMPISFFLWPPTPCSSSPLLGYTNTQEPLPALPLSLGSRACVVKTSSFGSRQICIQFSRFCFTSSFECKALGEVTSMPLRPHLLNETPVSIISRELSLGSHCCSLNPPLQKHPWLLCLPSQGPDSSPSPRMVDEKDSNLESSDVFQLNHYEVVIRKVFVNCHLVRSKSCKDLAI